MSDVSLTVPEGEGGILRIFSVATDTPDGAALRDALRDEADTAGALAGRALGTDAVDPWWVTLVQTRDVREIGLAGYLAEGHGVGRDQLDTAAAALERGGDTLLLVQSPAFGGRAATLDPADCLTPLAEFDTAGSPAPARAMAPAQAAPTGRPTSKAPAQPSRSPALRPTTILAILAAAALVVALVGLGGD